MGKANNWVILAKVKAPGQQAKSGQQCEGSASPQELCVLSKPGGLAPDTAPELQHTEPWCSARQPSLPYLSPQETEGGK